MFCKGIQYGVCSFGFSYTGEPEGCGLPNQQEIYSFIYHHRKWLDNILNPNKNKKKKKKKSSRGCGVPYAPAAAQEAVRWIVAVGPIQEGQHKLEGHARHQGRTRN